MKRPVLLLTAVLMIGIALAPLTVLAQTRTHVTGGGTATFGADLDGDGDIDGSQFGMGVIIEGGSAKGHFECLMAGRSDFGGLHLMAVEGQVDAGSASTALGIATFSGSGTLHIDGNKEDVNFVVNVQEGGPGVGKLQLTVTGIDTPGFPPAVTFPPETVASGRIKVH